jgi:hypothetical protein
MSCDFEDPALCRKAAIGTSRSPITGCDGKFWLADFLLDLVGM